MTNPDPAVAPQPGAQAPVFAAPPMQLTQQVETEPLEYHRLYRGIQKYRWWKPLLVALLTLVFFATLSVFFGLLLGGILSLVYPLEDVVTMTERFLVIDTQDPASVGFNLATVALTMMPSVLLAMWAVGIKPVGRVFSVAARLRWGLVGRTAWFSVLAIVVMNALALLIGLLFPVTGSAEVEPVDIDIRATMLSLLFVFLLVPFQAAAEEIVFRGVCMQVIGSWLRSPWFAILIPSLAFALAHMPTYGVWGMLSVGMMGVVAGWLTWRTGGLEAAISIHIVNNLFAFVMMSTGLQGSTHQTDDAVNPLGLIGQAVGFAFFIWITLRSFSKHGYGWKRIDVLSVPVAPNQVTP